MERECPQCGAICQGEDLGDHPYHFTFVCECGYYWGEHV